MLANVIYHAAGLGAFPRQNRLSKQCRNDIGLRRSKHG